MAMNQELKEKWVKALRSGDYKQDTGKLRSEEDGFCCLGVAVDVLMPKEWVNSGDSYFPHWTAGPKQELLMPTEGDNNTTEGFLPPRLAKRIGITQRRQEILAKMNDDGKAFPEIADYIEKNL